MRPINEIIIHCTATRPNWWEGKSAQEKVDEVRRWHLDRNWSDVGYHYLIDRNGQIVEGRPVERAGAHVKGHNANSIGISLFGGHGSSASDSFDDHFTKDQEQSLKRLIADLRDRFPDINKVTGHNQYSVKACPGFSVPDWLAQKPAQEMRPPVRSQERTSPTQSRTVQASVVAAGSAAGSAVTALSALDSVAQYIVLGFAGLGILMALWIMRERLRKWAEGDR